MALTEQQEETLRQAAPALFGVYQSARRNVDDWTKASGLNGKSIDVGDARDNVINTFLQSGSVKALDEQVANDGGLRANLLNALRDDPSFLNGVLPQMLENPGQAGETLNKAFADRNSKPADAKPEAQQQDLSDNNPKEPPKADAPAAEENPEPAVIPIADRPKNQAELPKSLQSAISSNDMMQNALIMDGYLRLMDYGQHINGSDPDQAALGNLGSYLTRHGVETVGKSEFESTHAQWAEKLGEKFLEDDAAQERLSVLAKRAANGEELDRYDTAALQAGLLAHGHASIYNRDIGRLAMARDPLVGEIAVMSQPTLRAANIHLLANDDPEAQQRFQDVLARSQAGEQLTPAEVTLMQDGLTLKGYEPKPEFLGNPVQTGILDKPTLAAASAYAAAHPAPLPLSEQSPVVDIGADLSQPALPTKEDFSGLPPAPPAKVSMADDVQVLPGGEDVLAQAEDAIRKAKPQEPVSDPQVMEAQAYLRIFERDAGMAVSVDGINDAQTQQALKNYMESQNIGPEASLDDVVKSMRTRILDHDKDQTISQKLVGVVAGAEPGDPADPDDVRAVQYVLKLTDKDVAVTGEMDKGTIDSYGKFAWAAAWRNEDVAPSPNTPRPTATRTDNKGSGQALENNAPTATRTDDPAPAARRVGDDKGASESRQNNHGYGRKPDGTIDVKVGEDKDRKYLGSVKFNPNANLVAGDDYNQVLGRGTLNDIRTGQPVGRIDLGGVRIEAQNPLYRAERNLENDINRNILRGTGIRVDF